MENRTEYLIEHFFTNQLSIEEANELRQAVAADPAVAESWRFQQQISRAVQSAKLDKGIQNQAWREAASQGFRTAGVLKTSFIPRYALAAAAAVALLVVAYIFLQPPTVQEIVAKQTGDFQNILPIKTMSADPSLATPEVIQAFGYYDDGQYAAAAKALTPIVAKYPEHLDYRFYQGVALVKTAQYNEAMGALRPVAAADNEYQAPAYYYLGLACAGAGNNAEARQFLNQYLADDEGITYRKQAETVLKALPQ